MLASVLVVMVAMAHLAMASSHIDKGPMPKEWPCPEANQVYPCVCTSDEARNLRLDCSDATSDTLLETALAADFPFEHFLELQITQDKETTDLSNLHDGVFQRLTFDRIIIRGTKISTIEDSVFSYSHDNLTLLNLSGNDINDFPFEAIASYLSLESLILDNNQLPILDRMETTSLQTLSMKGNTGLKVESDAFLDTPNLRSINLASINLESVPRALFAPLSNIEVIILDDNNMIELLENAINPPDNPLAILSITKNSLPNVAFNSIQGLSSGATLDMTSNRITQLLKVIWKPIFDQLLPDGEINLTGNSLDCGCDMSWIFLDPDKKYLDIINEQTTCYDGTEVIFLDPNFFYYQCS